MTDLPKVPDFMELLLNSIVARVRAAMQEELHLMVAENAQMVHADAIDGLEKFVNDQIEEYIRITPIKVDADDIEDLDSSIKGVLKNANITIDV